MRNPLARLARRNPKQPALRQRLASLKASAARVMRSSGLNPADLPAPGSDKAKAMFAAACTETDRQQRLAGDYPELKRDSLTWWTRDSLTTALEAGEIGPSEFARLYLKAAEREARYDLAAIKTGVGALNALAFAESYPLPAASPDPNPSTGADPIFAAIAEAQAADAAVQAWSKQAAARGVDACGGFAREEELTSRQSRAIDAALTTVPTTADGRRSLVHFADWLIEQHDTADGTLQDGAHTIFDRAYSALAHAIRKERAEPAPDLSVVPLDNLFGLADLYGSASRHFHIGAFWPKVGDDGPQSGKNLAIREGDRMDWMLEAIVAEIDKREPSDGLEADQQGEWLIRRAAEGGNWERVAALAARTPANVERAFSRSEAVRWAKAPRV